MSDTTNATTGTSVDTNGTVTESGQTQQRTSTTDSSGITTAAGGGTTAGQHKHRIPDQTDSHATPRSYSEDDYQKMSTSQYKAGMAAAMKEAGFEPDKSAEFQKQMQAFKKWQNEQKSDAERLADEAKTARESLAAEQARATMAERKFSALAKGIPADRAERYVTLAASYLGEDGDFEKALDAALADFPLPKGEGVPKIVVPHQNQTEQPKKAYKPPTVI